MRFFISYKPLLYQDEFLKSFLSTDENFFIKNKKLLFNKIEYIQDKCKHNYRRYYKDSSVTYFRSFFVKISSECMLCGKNLL